MALADLRKIRQLSPALQNEIAAKVATFINLASVSSNDALLYQSLAVAMQDRRDAIASGATSITDVRWAAAALSEAWCGAKLGKSQGRISTATATAIMQAIEQFAFHTMTR